MRMRERERERERERKRERERERERDYKTMWQSPAIQCMRTRPFISSTRSINFFASPMTDTISSVGESKEK